MPPSRKRKRSAKRRSPRINAARFTRRKVRRSRASPSVTVHRYIRMCQNGNPPDQSCNIELPNGVVEVAYSPVIKFNNMSGNSEFTALYDLYKIHKVTFMFQLINNPDAAYFNNTNAANFSSIYPKIWWVYDPDDNNSITLDDIKQYATVKCAVLQPNKLIRVPVRPNILVQAYQSAVSTQYFPAYNKWIDMTLNTTPYYGIKFVIESNTVTPHLSSPYKIRCDAKYVFSCKNPR